MAPGWGKVPAGKRNEGRLTFRAHGRPLGRSPEPARAPETFVLGALAIAYERRAITVGGAEVDLTPTEYELLRLLSVNAGRVVRFDTLLRRIWDGRDGADANLVRTFVRTLRAKLGDDAQDPTWIFNRRGVGYRMPRPGER